MPKEGVNQYVANFNVQHESGNRCSSEKSKICQNNMKNFDKNFVTLNEFVDGGNFLQDMKIMEDDIKSKCWNHRKKSDVARERWKLLAKALLKPKRNCSRSVKDISVRRFTSFDLITPHKLETKEKLEGCWLKYTTRIQNAKYVAEIHHLQQKLTAEELIGFNNTGNICIWPSEEVLAYYLLANMPAFAGKEVLEIGGGMTCLAGIMLGKYGKVKRMDLTDGNKLSVDNVERILVKNQLEKSKFRCFQLNWHEYHKVMDKYDIVLSSDCLFFDETRTDLVDTIWHSLRESGVALVTAPRRGNTLDLFLGKAIEKGFFCVSQTYYNETVWKQHMKFKESCSEYDEDIHYPILLMLTKSVQGFSVHSRPSLLKQTDYWVSQERKFCEFCKCYISANKASIEFHENGKNHKENLAKRLTEMQKKAAKEAKDALKFDNEMKRIEAAALRAYVKDIEFNPDFTSQTIGKIEIPDAPELPKRSNPGPARHKQERPPAPPKPTKKWMEAVTDEGTSYYWNTETKESVWDPPEEGFMSLEEQKNQKAPKAPKPSKFKKKFSKKQWKSGGQKRKEVLSKAKEEEKEKPVIEFGPIFQGHPYGKWEKVEVKSEKPVDLQLPEQEFVKIVVPSIKEESERKFKEKKIPDPGSIVSATSETGFKKRKFASGPKRNIRQRLDDD